MFPSPYVPHSTGEFILKPAILEEIRRKLGVKCMLIVVQKEKHNCSGEEKCLGHKIESAIFGFEDSDVHTVLDVIGNNISNKPKLPDIEM